MKKRSPIFQSATGSVRVADTVIRQVDAAKTRGKALADRMAAERRRAERERLENTLAFQLQARRIGGYRREVEWHPRRKFRSDFLWPEERVIVEVEGGQWTQGRHQRGGGFQADCEKYAEAALMGFTVLRFTTNHTEPGCRLCVCQRD